MNAARLGMSAALLVLPCMSVAAQADDPRGVVEAVYGEIAAGAPEPDARFPAMRRPENRADHFAPALVALFDRDDRLTASRGGIGCIDFAIELDGNDFDEAEIGRTLRVEEVSRTAATATVDARFDVFGAPNHFRWSFVADGDRWMIADIESVGNWRLSETPCG